MSDSIQGRYPCVSPILSHVLTSDGEMHKVSLASSTPDLEVKLKVISQSLERTVAVWL